LQLQEKAFAFPGVSLWHIPGAVELEEELSKLTRYYVTWSRYFIVGPRYTGDKAKNGIGIAYMHLRGGGLQELQAKQAIESLLREGLLERLSICSNCNRNWVFRARSDRRTCSDKCRQARYESTPQRKMQKQRNAKVRYARKKAQDNCARERRAKRERIAWHRRIV
jgi:hypothetical protein